MYLVYIAEAFIYVQVLGEVYARAFKIVETYQQ